MRATALKISPQQKKKRIQKKKIHTKFTQFADFESKQKKTTHNNNETNLPKKKERYKIEKLECIKRKAKQMIGQ